MKDEYDFSKGKRGPVIPHDPNKVRITIRLDADIVDYFKDQVHKGGGGNYQTMINNALREYLNQKHEPIDEDTLRRVIREELQAAN
ncbi:MAG: BrnA antitoxin family protein [bacterium]